MRCSGWCYITLKPAFVSHIALKITRKTDKSLNSHSQVHRAYMHVSMVPDEHIIEEMTPDLDDEEEIDFAQGLCENSSFCSLTSEEC